MKLILPSEKSILIDDTSTVIIESKSEDLITVVRNGVPSTHRRTTIFSKLRSILGDKAQAVESLKL